MLFLHPYYELHLFLSLQKRITTIQIIQLFQLFYNYIIVCVFIFYLCSNFLLE